MLLLVTFGILPILVAAVISTTNMNISAFANWNNVDFVGVDNYTKLFADPDFWQAIGNTGLFAVFGVPAIVILSLDSRPAARPQPELVLSLASCVLLHPRDHRDRGDLARLGLPLQHAVRPAQLPALAGRECRRCSGSPIRCSPSSRSRSSRSGADRASTSSSSSRRCRGCRRSTSRRHLSTGPASGRRPSRSCSRLLRFAIFFVSGHDHDRVAAVLRRTVRAHRRRTARRHDVGVDLPLQGGLPAQPVRVRERGLRSCSFAIIAVITLIQLRLRRADDDY